jgi:hypothetical protein
VMGQVDAFRGLVAGVVEMGVHPYSRASRPSWLSAAPDMTVWRCASATAHRGAGRCD